MAIKLREAGMRVIRCAHYPQDPAFMDACDALGMFVIITTPGWQFWNKDPVFEQRVFMDIRNMVRRDRNRPSAWLWEPILNETDYPGYFAERVHQITHEEYPHPGCYTACDSGAAGQEHFDVVYAGLDHGFYDHEKRCIFTREWGDCPADWRAQASPSRVAKGWGERAQLLQADHYADPDYIFASCYETLCAAPAQHVGGALWHGTDHQRGYHADAFCRNSAGARPSSWFAPESRPVSSPSVPNRRIRGNVYPCAARSVSSPSSRPVPNSFVSGLKPECAGNRQERLLGRR